MKTHRIGIIMNGVTGRMGTNQHLIRSIKAIIDQGGVRLSDAETIMPEPVLVGRSEDKLKSLGASEIIERASLSGPAKLLGKERWAAAVDCVGSHTLANVLAQTSYEGAVAACGLAQGMDLPTSVAPFILRGVSLLGIDSVMKPKAARLIAWERLARDLDREKIAEISATIGFGEVIDTAHKILEGKVRGRVIVEIG